MFGGPETAARRFGTRVLVGSRLQGPCVPTAVLAEHGSLGFAVASEPIAPYSRRVSTPEELIVVANPRAGAGKATKLMPRLKRALESSGAAVDLRLTEGPRHATELVREALREGAEGIAVVGGDGTMNEAVNGFFDEGGEPLRPGAWLGPLPCGTGGDFRKTVGIPQTPEAMASRLLEASPRALDIGWLEFIDHDGNAATRAFLNITSFGVSGEVDRIVNDSPKWMGGRLAFFVGTLRGMARYRNQDVELRVDGGPPRVASVFNLAVSNGQFFGGGMHIAPKAEIDDGLFDIVGIERDGAMGLVGLGPALYNGRILEAEGVSFARGQKLEATPLGDVPVGLDVDGEAPGVLPATFTVRSGVVRLR